MRPLPIPPPPKKKAVVVHFSVDQRFRRLITVLSWLLAACLHVILPSQRTKSAQFQRTEFSKFPGGEYPKNTQKTALPALVWSVSSIGSHPPAKKKPAYRPVLLVLVIC